MGVFDLYSKRQKKARGDVPDVYVYDEIPGPLRVQIIHILREKVGAEEEDYRGQTATGRAYEEIVTILRKEYGLFVLPGTHSSRDENYFEELSKFILAEKDSERVLDAFELSCIAIDTYVRNGEIYYRHGNEEADAAIAEINHRLMEHGVGYQYAEGKIIRIDSQLIHSAVVKPALKLLHDHQYAGAQDEFLNAHKHYRPGEYKAALVDCLKSLESILKAICHKRNWQYSPRATCSTLLQICFDNNLIPQFWNQHFSALRSTLESGVPTARNRIGGHGQGANVIDVPDYLVAYVLHQTASAIVFLAEAEKQLP